MVVSVQCHAVGNPSEILPIGTALAWGGADRPWSNVLQAVERGVSVHKSRVEATIVSNCGIVAPLGRRNAKKRTALENDFVGLNKSENLTHSWLTPFGRFPTDGKGRWHNVPRVAVEHDVYRITAGVGRATGPRHSRLIPRASISGRRSDVRIKQTIRDA